MVIGAVSKLNLGCYTVSLSSKPANLEGIANPDAMYFISVCVQDTNSIIYKLNSLCRMAKLYYVFVCITVFQGVWLNFFQGGLGQY